MTRRARARKVRHLLYKTEALIESALVPLPPLEPGSRLPMIAALSRRIEGLESGLAGTLKERDGLRNDLVEVTEERDDARTLANNAFEALTQAEEGVGMYARSLHEASKRASKAEARAEAADKASNRLQRIFAYTLALLTDEDRHQVVGFVDGIDAS
jgi:chromosome segregation ATPase